MTHALSIDVRRLLVCAALVAGCSSTDPDKQGVVSLFLHQPKGGELGASFVDRSARDARCPQTKVGPCTVSACSPQGARAASAGLVTVTGPGGATQVQSPYPARTMSFPDFAWMPGDTISFAAAGADVPAFAVDLAVAGAPSLTSSVKGPIDRATALPLTWNLAGPGDRFLVVLSQESLPETGFAECAFVAGASSGAIPAAALQLLPAGSYAISFYSAPEQRASAGDWSVDVRAATIAVDASGQEISGLLATLM